MHYVGKTTCVRERYRNHLKHAKRRPLRTHRDAWIAGVLAAGQRPVITILEECREDWRERERHWIKKYGRKDLGHGSLTNHTDGGDGLAQCSAALRKKLSDAHLGKVFSAETRAKKSRIHKGIVITPEWRKAMSDGKRGHRPPQAVKDKISARLRGRQRSPDAVRKAADSNRGRKRTPEQCQRIRDAVRGVPKRRRGQLLLPFAA